MTWLDGWECEWEWESAAKGTELNEGWDGRGRSNRRDMYKLKAVLYLYKRNQRKSVDCPAVQWLGGSLAENRRRPTGK